MCGIIVWIKKKGFVDQDIFLKSINSIIHRGPDSQKLYFLNTETNNYKLEYLKNHKIDNSNYDIAFGSTRFGTYDSKSRRSDMPMLSENKNNVISFNGDVYNFDELKNEMKSNGENFNTNVDTEVLFKGLINSGEKFLQKINSDYSFVFLDIKNKIITFSRDTFGAIPLFIFNDNDEIILSSEILPIKTILSKKKSLNFNYKFYDYFIKTNEWLYDKNSNLQAYEEINSVEPGSVSTINLNNFIINKSSEFSVTNLIKKNQKIHIDELENTLIKSIRYRLKTDKNLALFLSGGLDSSLIMAIYKKHLTKDFPPLEVFTSENYHNDLKYVELLSRDLNFKYNQVNIGYNEDIFTHIDDITIKTCLPTSTYGNSIGQYVMFKKMKELGKGIIITGHGGDQIFSGLFSHSNASFEYLKKYNLVESVNHLLFSKSIEGTTKLVLKNLINKFYSSLKLNKFYHIPHRFSDDQINLRSVKGQQINDILSGNFATSNNLINFISMSNSVAVRSPLIDRNLIYFINNNLEDKFKNGFDRYALRNILKKYENNVHKRKQKQGLRWRGKNLLPKYRDRIIDNIKQSSFYSDNEFLKSIINKSKNDSNYSDDIFLKYYSLARFEKLIL